MHTPDPAALFGTVRPIIGMIHLPPLPGAPAFGSMADVLAAARADATALDSGGVHGIMIENFGDAPFLPTGVAPETIAAITAAALAVRQLTPLPVGINILRNDARAALGVAAVVGASFIRVNVHTGAMLTDQGWINGRAHETMRTRAALRCSIAVFADVLVKHAVPPPGLDIADAARDTVLRGRADAVIVSGSATGTAADPARIRAVRDAVQCPVFVGSGVTEESVVELLGIADGAIIGSAFQHDGRAGNRVDVARVRRITQLVHDMGT